MIQRASNFSYDLSLKRSLWLLLCFCAFFAIFFSHFIMQEYLFLQPCEQCVYIRYAFMILGIGCLVVAISPKHFFFQCAGGIIIVYAIIRGITFSLTLHHIHKALQSETMAFGIKGCALVPQYDFGLLWHIWFPQIFNPTGFCGLDMPVLTENLSSPLQKSLIEFYANGWYLIPSIRFGSMAECALAIFLMYAVFLFFLFISNFIRKIPY